MPRAKTWWPASATPNQIENLAEELPEAYKQFMDITAKLEKHYKDMQDVEFTIERGKLWMLQTRNGKRTAAAAVKIAVDMVERRPDHQGRGRHARDPRAGRHAAAPAVRRQGQEDRPRKKAASSPRA